MRFLFIHHSFPGQFWHLVQALSQDRNNTVVFVSTANPGHIPGVKRVHYTPAGGPNPNTHRYLRSMENGVHHGQAVAQALSRLKRQGFVPDVVCGHYGWGASMFVRDILPQVPFLGYFEWFYKDRYGYAGTVTETGSLSEDEKSYLRLKNLPVWVTLQACDRALTPTHWQRSQFPPEYQGKFTVLPDGINTDLFQPAPGAGLNLSEQNLVLPAGTEIITYVARALEPSRGFEQFIEALGIILKQRPHCHAVLVGSDKTEYNRPLPDGKTYKQWALERCPLDLARVHFTGWLDYDKYRSVLQASSVHVYLTHPFILSWSLTESLACGCLVVASDNGPLQEIIRDGVNGFLIDGGSPQAIAEKVISVLEKREEMAGIRRQAHKTILDTYSIRAVLPQQMELLNRLAGPQSES